MATDENLTEHVVGDEWRPHAVRLEMLAEAIEIIRERWDSEEYSHQREHFPVDSARLFTVPDEPPLIYVAAGEQATARTAVELRRPDRNVARRGSGRGVRASGVRQRVRPAGRAGAGVVLEGDADSVLPKF